MSGWVRVDTRFTTHPKVLDIGPLGEALWLRGLCYAGEHLTDGFVPAAFIRRMGDLNGVDVAGQLVQAGLWTEADGGYQIHEYLDWQRSRDEVAEISGKRAEAGRKGGLQKASNLLANGKQPSSKLLGSPASKRLADTDTDTDTDTEKRGSNEPLPADAGDGGEEESRPPIYSTDFEAFWQQYPRGRGSKAKSFAEWRKLRRAERDDATAALPSWLRCEMWQDPSKVIYCERWLKARAWENDAPPAARQVANGRVDFRARIGQPTERPEPDNVIEGAWR